MATSSCITNSKLAKIALKDDLNRAITDRLNATGGDDPRFDPGVIIRDVTAEHLADIRARKVREALQFNAISRYVDTRLTAAGTAKGINPWGRSAASVLDRDVTERFNKFGLNATSAGRIFLSEIYRAGGPALDKLRARYWESWPALAKLGADHERKGMDVTELIKAMTGGSTTNTDMRELAHALSRMSDLAIANYRKVGGEIGKQDHFVPHDWIADKVARTAKDEWVNEILGNVPGTPTPILDRSRIMDVNTGKPLTAGQLRTALEDAYEDISSDGLNKIAAEPGKYRSGRALYRQQTLSRFLHFTPEGYIHVLPKYMHGDIATTMLAWFDRMGRDTGTMHVMGPQPLLTVRYIGDKLRLAKPGDAGKSLDNKWQKQWQTFNSQNPIDKPVTLTTAHAFSAVRTFTGLNLLGSAAVHSAAIGDFMAQVLRLAKNGMGPFGYARDLVTALKNNDIDAAAYRDHQMIWDSRYFGMTDEARTYGDLRYANHRLGNVTTNMIDASGLEHLVQHEQIPAQVNLTRRFTDYASKSFNDLPSSRKRLFDQYGITPAQWDSVRANTLDTPLTSGSFKGIDYAKLYGSGAESQINAARQFQNMLIGETSASIYSTPHLLARAGLAFAQRGTVVGEIMRSVTQFGQWPLGAWHNQFGPLLGDKPLVTKAAYMSGLLLSSMIAGMLGIQARQILAGKTPLPMDDGRTWIAAALESNVGANWGSMAVRMLGLSDPFQQRGFDFANIFDLSPVFGQVKNLVVDPALQTYRHGARAGISSELTTLIRDVGAPFGLQMWQTKWAFERLVIDNLQRLVDPAGYQQRQSRIAQYVQRTGQSYLLSPDAFALP